MNCRATSAATRGAFGAGGEEGELIAAHAREETLAGGDDAESPQRSPERAVTDSMAMRVVHFLEPVKIEERDRDIGMDAADPRSCRWTWRGARFDWAGR